MIDGSKYPIEVVCDGGGVYGYGHIQRSYALAKELEKRKHPVKYTVISKFGKKVIPSFTSTDIDPIVQVLDLPYEIQSWVDLANKKNIRTVALDYFGNARPTLTISVYEHRIPPPKGCRINGLKYALIRSNITQKAPTLPGEEVMIMIGGSDLNRVGESTAVMISEKGFKVNLIQGPAIRDNYSSTLTHVTVHKEPDRLESIMASCGWAITNGGGSMMEMMSLGKAVYVLPQTEAELNLAKMVIDKEAILGIGIDSISTPSSKQTIEVGKRARKLIDGQGINRVIDQIRAIGEWSSNDGR